MIAYLEELTRTAELDEATRIAAEINLSQAIPADPGLFENSINRKTILLKNNPQPLQSIHLDLAHRSL